MSEWFQTYDFRVVADGLAVGALPADGDDVGRLVGEAGITRVVNLCQDVEYADGARRAVEAAYAAAGIAEHRIDLVDFGHVTAEALDEAVAVAVPWLADGEVVYVHCRAGWQRSATVGSAILAVHLGTGVEEALHQIRYRKPSAQPLHHQLEGLHRWWAARTTADAAADDPEAEAPPAAIAD